MHGAGGPEMAGASAANCPYVQVSQEIETAQQESGIEPEMSLEDAMAFAGLAGEQIMASAGVERPVEQLEMREEAKAEEAATEKTADKARRDVEASRFKREPKEAPKPPKPEVKHVPESAIAYARQVEERAYGPVVSKQTEGKPVPVKKAEKPIKVVAESRKAPEVRKSPVKVEPKPKAVRSEAKVIDIRPKLEQREKEKREKQRQEKERKERTVKTTTVVARAVVAPIIPIVEKVRKQEPESVKPIDSQIRTEEKSSILGAMFANEIISDKESTPAVDVPAVHDELIDLIVFENVADRNVDSTVSENLEDEIAPIVMSMAEIIEAAPEQGLEQTLGQLKTHIELTPDAGESEVVATIRELVDSIKELQAPVVDGYEKIVITPEITEKLLSVIEKLGYDEPDKVLIEFVQLRGFRELMEILQVLAESKPQLIETPETRVGLQLYVRDDRDDAAVDADSIQAYEGNKVGNIAFRAAMIRPSFDFAA